MEKQTQQEKPVLSLPGEFYDRLLAALGRGEAFAALYEAKEAADRGERL